MESNEFFYEKCDCCGSTHRSDKECKGCAEIETDFISPDYCLSCGNACCTCDPCYQDELPF